MDSIQMKYKTKRDLLLSLVLLLIGFVIGFFSKYLFRESTHTESLIIQAKASQELVTDAKQHSHEGLTGIEYNFTATIRNCLGPECYDSRPAKSDVDRVGILALPGSGVQAMLVILRKAARKTTLKFEIELDTHVPAYGYGKNHGWNRIVRISRKLIPHAYSLLKNLYPSTGNGSSIPIRAYETQIRQLTRWHCRLSHVAAHTKMLTGACYYTFHEYGMFLEDVYSKPMVEMERMLTFIGVPVQRPELLAAVAEMDLRSFRRDDEDVPAQLREAGLRMLHEEMRSTNGLSDWPCKPFRELENDAVRLRLQLLTQHLAPNCSNPFVKCTVGFDLKEQVEV